jgi:hypothetical protein
MFEQATRQVHREGGSDDVKISDPICDKLEIKIESRHAPSMSKVTVKHADKSRGRRSASASVDATHGPPVRGYAAALFDLRSVATAMDGSVLPVVSELANRPAIADIITKLHTTGEHALVIDI